MKILDLPELDRPRERLLKEGAAALSARELLALLLGSGLPGQDAIELAATLINDCGGLVGLAAAKPEKLRQVPGVGSAKAVRVAAAFELAKRARVEPVTRRRIAKTPDVVEVAAPYLRGLRHERVVVAVCDNSGGLLRVAPLTDGGSDRSLIPVKDVLTTVLSIGGVQFGVAHNHPSGVAHPSDADVEVTGLLRRAADTVGLRFIDHVIVTESRWERVP